MIEVIDLKEVRNESHDLLELQTLVKQLIGQPFRFFKVAYADELRLHLGNLQSYSSPKMRNRLRGSYIIAARASSWIVYSAPTSLLLASDDAEFSAANERASRVDITRIEVAGHITPGAPLTAVTPSRSPLGFTLQLEFADRSTVFIKPSPETREEGPDGNGEVAESANRAISDWEILTPHSRVLRVGPGERWCYLDSTKKNND